MSGAHATNGWYILHVNEGAEELVDEVWHAAAAIGTEFSDADAVFKKIRPGLGLALYFTPSASLLAKIFGATRCRKPNQIGLELYLGQKRAWQIHFACGGPLREPAPASATAARLEADPFAA